MAGQWRGMAQTGPMPPRLAPSLPGAFFDRPVLEVAPELLGATVSLTGVTVRLTEVEAYDGVGDPGSHAFRGRTPRTEVMFGPPGGLYVYFTYGMHWCANLVCGPEGHAAAVLLRAGEVVAGETLARARRGGVPFRDLARGPARLTVTLGLGREHNGLRTDRRGSPVRLEAARPAPDPRRIRTGPRVGVSGPGGDGTAYPWRFWLDGEPTVSVYRPGTLRSRSPSVG
jgi:DNA-3-methyladenine glycosylase